MVKKVKKGKSKKKSTKKTKVKKPTVVTIPSPEGSVHFNEFLINCKLPKLPPIPPAPVKKGKKGKNNKKSKKKPAKGKKNKKQGKAGKAGKGKKGKKARLAKKKVVVKPDVIPPTIIEPPLFPLIKALLLPTDDGDFVGNALYSDFVVGKNEDAAADSSPRSVPTDELNVLEKRANDTVDEINKVQENIRVLKEKPKPNKTEAIMLEQQQSLLIRLLDDFEKYLGKIRTVFDDERQATGAADNARDDEEWADVADGPQQIAPADERKCWSPAADSETGPDDEYAAAKWYEGNDLAYLLSPSTSFNKQVSDEFLRKIIDEARDNGSGQQPDQIRKDLFKRLRDKFSILIPPPKLEATKDHLAWIDKKLYKDHVSMLKATGNLKLFQCWDHLELKYDIITALAVSLKNAVKSTAPIYYANNDMKAQFASDQSELVQALDDFQRKTKHVYQKAGLADYWQIHPQSIRLGVRPGYEISIRQLKTDIDDVIKLDEQNLSFVERSVFITNSRSNCERKGITEKTSKDSEIEVEVFNLT